MSLPTDIEMGPAHHELAAEMLAAVTGIARHEDAALVIHHLATLKAMGEDNATIIKWLTLLPRARAREAAR